MKLRIVPLLGAAAAVLGLAVSGASAASASTAAPAPVVAGPVSTHWSESLAGQSADGNGPVDFQGVWRQITVEPQSATDTTDSVAVGLLMAQNLAIGNEAYGEALVLNDPSGCGAGAWTVEAGAGTITLPSQPVLPTSDLSPILYFGEPICLPANVTESEFLYEYHSSGHHEVDFSAGPSSTDYNVLQTDHIPGFTFRVPASGITTSTGANAQLLLGQVLDPSGIGVFESGHGNSVFGQGVNLSTLQYDMWQGSENGTPPTVGNPQTLTTSPMVGIYGVTGISAP